MRLSVFRFLTFLIAVVCFDAVAHCQSWNLSGFVSEMPSYVWQKHNTNYADNLIHNRLNIQHSFKSRFSLNIEFRNRWFWGESIKNDATRKYVIDSDPGAVDLSMNIGSDNSYVINSKVDRLSLSFRKGIFDIKLGRQRADWGLSKIWNPNDVFNTYSFYDFDYEAKPGMDGAIVKMGKNDKHSVVTVFKVDNNQKVSFAAMYRANINSVAMQVMAGQVNKEDYVMGLGWKYTNANFSIYGETTYLSPINNRSNDHKIGTLGLSYRLGKVNVSTEYLYSDYLEERVGDINALMNQGVSLKNLSISDHSYNLSMQYDFSGKLTSTFDYIGFGFPLFDGMFLGSSTHVKVADDLVVSVIVQGFSQNWLPDKEKSLFLYARLKKTF